MKTGKFLVTVLSVVAAAALLGLFFREVPFDAPVRMEQELGATVAEIEKAGESEWTVPEAAVVQEGGNNAYIFVLKKLRAKKIEVFQTGSAGEKLIVKSESLGPGDLILTSPSPVRDGAAIAVTGGLDEKRSVQLTLNAAIAAVNEASLQESMRFVSLEYTDRMGFDHDLLSKLLRRAFKEFSQPWIEIVQGPDIQLQGAEAIVSGSIRLQALYRGKRNYLLGGPDSSNTLWLRMEKKPGGWKLAEMRGLMPLDFDERAMRLLGSELGMPLSARETAEKKEFCMRCRGKMAERFGTGK